MKGIFIMQNRYIFFKRLFPNYLVIFIKNNKYWTIGIDKKIIKYQKNNDIDYVVINDENKVNIIKGKVNNYDFYIYQEFLLDLIKKLFIFNLVNDKILL